MTIAPVRPAGTKTLFGGQTPVFGATRKEATGEDFFCKVHRGEIPDRLKVTENERSFGVLDGYPVGEGHTLIVPKRHFASLFEATQAEMMDIFRSLKDAKAKIEAALTAKGKPLPDGYNVGINVGEAAGQTVGHLHVHLIPRYNGDMADPRGGVRGVIPEKQKYSGPPDPAVEDLFKA